jgi:hypothetical protein
LFCPAVMNAASSRFPAFFDRPLFSTPFVILNLDYKNARALKGDKANYLETETTGKVQYDFDESEMLRWERVTARRERAWALWLMRCLMSLPRAAKDWE